jgi:glycosyltransferase involved in cell wall biosynthesis
MTECPLVSVILPTHNRAGLVEAAIRSVLDQSYLELELIVVDDGSDDGTAEVVGRIQDRRLQLLRHQHCRGAAAARNSGVEASRGQLIAFQDSDDRWLPQRLQLQVATMLAAPPEVGVVYGSFVRVGTDRRALFPPRLVRWLHRLGLPGRRLDGDLSRSLLRGNLVTTQAALVRRHCIQGAGGFDPELVRFDDWDLWLSIAEEWRFIYVDAPLTEVRITPASLSTDTAAAVRDLERMAGKHPRARKPLLAVASYMEGERCLGQGRRRAGRGHLCRAVSLAPGNAWYWMALLSSLAGRRGLSLAGRITGLGYHRES